MPPKDTKIGRMNGRLFIPTENGYRPLGEVQEVELTEEAETFAEDQEPIIKAADSGELSFTATLNADCQAILDKLAEGAKAWNLLWETLGPIFDRLAKDPRTPKLVHLVKHGKNRRIRKKNAKRLVRIMKGE